jgi:hypothetical protein
MLIGISDVFAHFSKRLSHEDSLSPRVPCEELPHSCQQNERGDRVAQQQGDPSPVNLMCTYYGISNSDADTFHCQFSGENSCSLYYANNRNVNIITPASGRIFYNGTDIMR